MPRILAIEADLKRRQVLTALVREHVKANLVVVASVRAAIDSIAEQTPDLIISPALLSPPDEAELLTHMKGLDTAPYIQMLTVPALDMLVDAPREETRRRSLFGPVFTRRPQSLGLQDDRNMVAAQIVDGLERARELRMQYAAMLAYQEAASHAPRESSLVLARPGGREIAEAGDAFIEQQLSDRASDERRIALRKSHGDVPWLSGIKVSWGAELQLINISSTGVLVETGSKFAPGSTTNLQLCGPETNLVVPVRFIRSDVRANRRARCPLPRRRRLHQRDRFDGTPARCRPAVDAAGSPRRAARVRAVARARASRAGARQICAGNSSARGRTRRASERGGSGIPRAGGKRSTSMCQATTGRVQRYR